MGICNNRLPIGESIVFESVEVNLSLSSNLLYINVVRFGVDQSNSLYDKNQSSIIYVIQLTIHLKTVATINSLKTDFNDCSLQDLVAWLFS